MIPGTDASPAHLAKAWLLPGVLAGCTFGKRELAGEFFVEEPSSSANHGTRLISSHCHGNGSARKWLVRLTTSEMLYIDLGVGGEWGCGAPWICLSLELLLLLGLGCEKT